MKKYLLSLAVMAMGATLLTSCLGDDPKGDTSTEYIYTRGVYVINNGSAYQSIDGSLSYIDYSTGTPIAQQNVYKKANGTSLGGTPNDVAAYGQKVYIAGFDENILFVLDARTQKEIAKLNTIDLLGGTDGKGPRHIVAYGGKVYFTTYGEGENGYVAAIDTTSFNLKAKYQVGPYPEGMAFGMTSDGTVNKLYVANSDYGNGNGSISIIDLTSGTASLFKNEKIRNPQEILVPYPSNVIYVLDSGYYDEAWTQKEAGVFMINGNNVSLVVPNATGMAADGNYIYTYNDPFGGTGPTFSIYNIGSKSTWTLNLTGDSSHPLISPCAISVDPNTGYLYIASRPLDPDTGYPSYAMSGYVNVYQGYNNASNPGQFEESFPAGVEPHKIEFSYGIGKLQY